MDHVTDAELAALLGTGADPARVTRATTAANQLIDHWIKPATDTLPAVTSASAQAGLELAHQLYRRHAAVGGIFTVDELVARLPADLTRGIRDLLEADTHWWGVA